MTLTDGQGTVIAGTPLTLSKADRKWYDINTPKSTEYSMPIAPVGRHSISRCRHTAPP